MRLSLAMAALVLTAAGCPGGGTGDGSTGTAPAGSSTGVAESGGPTSTPQDDSTSSGGFAGTQDGTTVSGSESTTAGDTTSSGSTGGDCPPGTAGCPCDAGLCDGGLVCTNETCAAPGSCAEHPEGEPNDSEAEAIELGAVAGCAVAQVSGAVDQGDSDWFRYQGTVDPECNLDTSALVNSDPDLTICMFWECDQGAEQVVCFGMPEAQSPTGLMGCCGSAGNAVFMLKECLGVGDLPNGTVTMEVRGPDAPMCVAYDLAYIF